MRELLPYLRLLGACRGRLAAGALLMLATSLASIGLLGLAGWFITATGVAGLAVAAGARMTLDIYTPGAGIRAFALTRTAARYGERVIHHDAILGLLARLRTRVFAALTRLDPRTAARFSGGEILHRLTSDVDALDQLYLRSIAPPAVALLALVTLATGTYFIDATLALAIGGGLLAVAITVFLVTTRTSGRAGWAIVDHGERLRAQAVSALAGLAELRAFGSWPRQREHLDAEGEALVAAQRHNAWVTAAGEAAVTLAVHGVAAAALVAGLLAHSEGERTLAVAVLVPLAVLGLTELLGQVPAGGATLGRTRSAAARLNRQLATAAAVSAPPTPAAPPPGNELALEQVGFRPGPLADPVLSGADLRIREGETTVVTGPSGSGKSTLGDLCARLIDPDSGRVTLGGTDLRALEPKALRARISYLRQDEHLFAETIRENLRIAAADADDTALWHALWVTALDERIAALDDGLDSWLGSGGTGLSGGEARRLALARVVLATRPVVVLDEPLAGLDADTAATVADRLARVLADRTAIVLAHAGAAMPRPDHHYELRHGRLREAGG